MARITSDFLPLNGTNFFDMSGEMAPQLRVYMSVPNDVDAGYFNYASGGGVAKAKERFENQDKLKNLLIERYRNLVQVRLQAMRRDRHNSIIGVFKQTIDLEKGVRMDYDSLWGREYVTLYFSEELVRRLIKELEMGGGYLLILHSGNKISYIPMSQIDRPKKSETKTLSSNWSSVHHKDSVQFKFGKNAHIVAVGGIEFAKDGHIKVTSVGIKSFFDNNYGEFADQYFYYCNAATSIFDGVREPNDGRALSRFFPTRWHVFGGPATFTDMTIGGYALVGTADKFYDQLGRCYSISKTGKIALDYSVGEGNWFYGGAGAIGIPDGQGGWYTPTYADGYSVAGMNVFRRGYTLSQERAFLDIPAWGTPGPSRPWQFGGPGPTDYQHGTDSSYNLIDRVLCYSNNGKVDHLEIKEVKFSGSFSFTPTYDGPVISGGATYGTISGSNNSGEGECRQIGGVHFGTDPKKDMWVWSIDLGVTAPYDNEIGFDRSIVCRTPYGDLYNGKFTTTVAPSQRSFVANGRVFLCYYHLEKKRGVKVGKVSFNRNDVTAIYEAALGITANQIDYILMNIKKSDIDKLK